MPRICQETHTRQCQDVLMHILYSGSCEALLHTLIMQSIHNITTDHPVSGVRQAILPFIPPNDCPLAVLRSIFFVLLNQDARMREALCSQRTLPYLPCLCAHKACRFYDHLKESVMVEWVKNENVHILEFVESLKEAYLVS